MSCPSLLVHQKSCSYTLYFTQVQISGVFWTGEEVVQPVIERRAAALAAALDYSAQSHSAGQDLLHLGPFYGLPSSVVQLLREHRGISQLYGKINIVQM